MSQYFLFLLNSQDIKNKYLTTYLIFFFLHNSHHAISTWFCIQMLYLLYFKPLKKVISLYIIYIDTTDTTDTR